MTWPLEVMNGEVAGINRVVTKVPKVDTPVSCPGAAPNESDLDSGVGQMLETPRIRRYSPFATLYGEGEWQ
jgi:hypothetical protein